MRVLVVEDDPEQRRLLTLVLQAHGHAVVECATYAEARRAGPCELAFVDRRLPDGDGLELARSLPGRVYLLTGDELDARGAGVEVLLKPVRPAELDALLG
ncbi:MAG: response regulator [Planctomycetota bacterium]